MSISRTTSGSLRVISHVHVSHLRICTFPLPCISTLTHFHIFAFSHFRIPIICICLINIVAFLYFCVICYMFVLSIASRFNISTCSCCRIINIAFHYFTFQILSIRKFLVFCFTTSIISHLRYSRMFIFSYFRYCCILIFSHVRMFNSFTSANSFATSISIPVSPPS